MKISLSKKVISFVLAFSLLVTVLTSSVYAADNNFENVNLNGHTIEIIENNANNCVARTTIEGDEYTLELNKNNEEFTLNVEDYHTTVFDIGIGAPEEKEYLIEVEDATPDYVVAEVIPEDNAEDIISIDDSAVVAQAPLIALGIGAGVAALIEAILAAAACLVVAGVTYYAANQVINSLKRKQENIHYYMAYLNYQDNVYIGPKINTKSKAAARLTAGLNVFATSQGYAFDVCKSSSPISKVSALQKHTGGGKNYHHYHPLLTANTQSRAHCWYA